MKFPDNTDPIHLVETAANRSELLKELVLLNLKSMKDVKLDALYPEHLVETTANRSELLIRERLLFNLKSTKDMMLDILYPEQKKESKESISKEWTVVNLNLGEVGRCLQAGDYKKANKLLEEAARTEPNVPEVYKLLGQCHESTNIDRSFKYYLVYCFFCSRDIDGWNKVVSMAVTQLNDASLGESILADAAFFVPWGMLRGASVLLPVGNVKIHPPIKNEPKLAGNLKPKADEGGLISLIPHTNNLILNNFKEEVDDSILPLSLSNPRTSHMMMQFPADTDPIDLVKSNDKLNLLNRLASFSYESMKDLNLTALFPDRYWKKPPKLLSSLYCLTCTEGARYLGSGDNKQAIELFERAARSVPNMPEVYKLLGECFESTNIDLSFKFYLVYCFFCAGEMDGWDKLLRMAVTEFNDIPLGESILAEAAIVVPCDQFEELKSVALDFYLLVEDHFCRKAGLEPDEAEIEIMNRIAQLETLSGKSKNWPAKAVKAGPKSADDLLPKKGGKSPAVGQD